VNTRPATPNQRRSVHLPEQESFELLTSGHFGAKIDPEVKDDESVGRTYLITITFDRDIYQPILMTSYSIGGESSYNHAKSYPLEYGRMIILTSLNTKLLDSVAADLKCGDLPLERESMTQILLCLIETFTPMKHRLSSRG